MYFTIYKTFHNHHLQLLATLSLNNQITTSTTTSLQHLKSLLPSKKIIFCYKLQIKFYEKPVSVINKLQPLSYQLATSNITSQPTPKICNATALLTHP